MLSLSSSFDIYSTMLGKYWFIYIIFIFLLYSSTGSGVSTLTLFRIGKIRENHVKNLFVRFLLFLNFCLKGRLIENEGQTERSFIYCFPKWLQQTKLNESEARKQEPCLGLLCGRRSPSTWAILLCFLKHNSRELHQKRSVWDSIRYLYGIQGTQIET